MALRLVPVGRDLAGAFVDAHHRHHSRPQGYRFAIGAALADRLCGVAIAGRPVSRHLDDGATLEVTRVCGDGTPHVCSMLYGACWRAARALGYTRVVTYTQDGESGASVRAAGWLLVADLAARSGWDTPSRRRENGVGIGRHRWEIRTADHGTVLVPRFDAAVESAQLPLDLAGVA